MKKKERRGGNLKNEEIRNKLSRKPTTNESIQRHEINERKKEMNKKKKTKNERKKKRQRERNKERKKKQTKKQRKKKIRT